MWYWMNVASNQQICYFMLFVYLVALVRFQAWALTRRHWVYTRELPMSGRVINLKSDWLCGRCDVPEGSIINLALRSLWCAQSKCYQPQWDFFLQKLLPLVLSGAAYLKYVSLCKWQKTPLSCFHCIFTDIKLPQKWTPILWVHSVIIFQFMFLCRILSAATL